MESRLKVTGRPDDVRVEYGPLKGPVVLDIGDLTLPQFSSTRSQWDSVRHDPESSTSVLTTDRCS